MKRRPKVFKNHWNSLKPTVSPPFFFSHRSLNSALVCSFLMTCMRGVGKVLEKYGRYYSRNEAMGRKSTLEEKEALRHGPGWGPPPDKQ